MFRDRAEAGRRLAEKLSVYRGPDTVVLAIPRGGVVVGREVAEALGAPLDVVIPRKLGAPGQPELAIGAIAGSGVRVMDESSVRYLRVSEEYINAEIERQRGEIERRMKLYRGDRPRDLKGRIVILVDDGMATGATTAAAARFLRQQQPEKLILAVPVASMDSVQRLRPEVDEVVALEVPEPFYAVGAWYEVFDQTTDSEVLSILQSGTHA